MRSLKFRVYSKRLKVYIDYYTIGFSKSGELQYLSDKHGAGPVFAGDYIVEQYTGDKDQYNTPICEGDIVRICETDIGEVLQDYDGRWIILGIPKEKLRDGDSVLLGNLEKLQKWCLADILSKEYCSVIGNIHENGELLGGEK